MATGIAWSRSEMGMVKYGCLCYRNPYRYPDLLAPGMDLSSYFYSYLLPPETLQYLVQNTIFVFISNYVPHNVESTKQWSKRPLITSKRPKNVNREQNISVQTSMLQIVNRKQNIGV